MPNFFVQIRRKYACFGWGEGYIFALILIYSPYFIVLFCFFRVENLCTKPPRKMCMAETTPCYLNALPFVIMAKLK